MKILLTGSTGFIGRNLKEAWEGRYDLNAPRREELDLLDTYAVEEYLKNGGFDVVVHAANTNDVLHEVSKYQVLDRNLRMFFNLERCSQYYGKMYFFGSGMEYDVRHYIPRMPESYFGRYIPQDPYGFSKYTMTKTAEHSNNIYNLRLFGVFGKYEEWQRRFISNMICRSIKGIPLKMRQNKYFDYLYIQDLLPILDWFLTNTPGCHQYNVCSGQRVSLRSLAELVNQCAAEPREITQETPGLQMEYTGDNSRLVGEIGPLSLTPMKKVIQELYLYYQSHESLIKEEQL